ncbi:hypothetical protein DPQ33_14650 [Oceanidesulfovibrio indonesiensis]|uniref:DUF3592 domain-containing protein n=1 Tax=Oceanidesulfovibrio indonesiensis TaxID=54767 RepID=A0A7M3MCE2_9BACT|nr:DUF3592 domain-containing protein [Oceanidesulfovibrio indonesiensis]TVM15637.1 hypothetical protein DPQ33_14650 [Oceanidesulfovibrio indonesiensis]
MTRNEEKMKGRDQDPYRQNKGDEIHPKLRPMMRVFTVMRWVFLGTVLGIAGMFLLLYLRKPDPTLLIMAGVVSVVTLALFLVMDRVLLATLKPRLERTNRLMLSIRPEPMRMHPTGVSGVQGYLVELKSRNAPDDAPPWGIASIATSGRRYLSRKPQDVLIYHDPADSKRSLAVEGDTNVYWGALTTPADREASWRQVNSVMLLAAAVLLVLGVGFFMLMDTRLNNARENVRLAEESAHWPSVRGVVTESSVQETRIRQGRNSVRGYKADVAYGYVVDGKNLTGSRIHFCYAPSRSVDHAETMAARYAPGAGIPVAYNPEAPAMSVLEAGFADACLAAQEDVWQEMLLIGALIVLTIGALLLVYLWQQKKRVQAARRLARYGIRF